MQRSVAQWDDVPSSGLTASNAVDPDVVVAAQLIKRLHHSAAALLPHLANAALCLMQVEGWKQHGFANVRDFARERFDRSGRWVHNLARLAPALQRMPALAAAVTGADGQRPLGRTALFEISRIARPETLATWIHLARQLDIHSLRERIRIEQFAKLGEAAQEVPAVEPAPGVELAPGVERAPAVELPGSETADALGAVSHVAARDARRTVRMATPAFLPPAFDDLERVHAASNPGCARSDYVDALVAEHSSLSAPQEECHLGGETSHRNTACKREVSSATTSAMAPAMAPAMASWEAVASAAASERIARCNHKEFLRALWAEQHVQAVLGESPTTSMDGFGDTGGPSSADAPSTKAELAVDAMQTALELERQVTLRQNQLLMWIDNRRAWSLLGFVDAADFGRRILDESAATLRNRLRVAWAMERSPAVHTAADLGKLTPERLVRIARMLYHHDLTEKEIQRWVEHASTITIKRLDDELRQHTRHRNHQPVPLSDQEWSEALRLAPGDARHRILSGGLQTLAEQPPADVFMQLNLPADTAAALRRCLNQTRRNLQAGCARMQSLSAGEEARLFPSMRIAKRYCDAARRIPDWLCLLSVLEEFAEEYDNPRNIQRRPTDTVTIRDGWRCTAPGCTAREVEVHHVVYQSQGGSDDASNLTSLCPFHHRMGEHGGLMRVTGTAPLALHWRLGRDGAGGEYDAERQVSRTPPACGSAEYFDHTGRF